MIKILMATYNGAKHIKSQIQSIIGQTFKDWVLLIHDDGSNDSTLEIIKFYSVIDPRIKLIEDGIKYGNAAKNFLHLTNIADGRFFIFCDQDDIWFESKLQVLYDKINILAVPCAVYCNAYTYNGLEITSNKVIYFHRKNLKDSLFLNGGVQGCSLMFNNELKEIIMKQPDFVFMHDHLYTMAAIAFGKLLYVDKSLMFYRQHSNNVTGNMSTNFLQRLKLFFRKGATVIDLEHYRANISFYEKYSDRLSNEQKKLFQQYFLFPKSNLFNRLLILLRNSFRIGKYPFSLLLKTILRKPL